MAADILASELQFYEERREVLASDHPGRFLLIHDSALHGTFDTLDGALVAGFSKFGSKPFLVRRAGALLIRTKAHHARLVSCTIALLHFVSAITRTGSFDACRPSCMSDEALEEPSHHACMSVNRGCVPEGGRTVEI